MVDVSPALNAELVEPSTVLGFDGVIYPIAREPSSVHFAGYAIAAKKAESSSPARKKQGTQEMIALILQTLQHCLGDAYEDWYDHFLSVDFPSLDASFDALSHCFNQVVEAVGSETGRPPVSSGVSSEPPSLGGTTWNPVHSHGDSSVPAVPQKPLEGSPSEPISHSSNERSESPANPINPVETKSPRLWTPSGP